MAVKSVFKLYQLKWEDFLSHFDSFSRYYDVKINQLSSGEIRIIETYLIICAKKEIILLDEPFSFIAPLYIDKFKKILIQEKKSKVILITDHFYDDILQLSDSVYLIKNRSSKLIKSEQDLISEGYLKSNQ